MENENETVYVIHGLNPTKPLDSDKISLLLAHISSEKERDENRSGDEVDTR
jgi:hypothetical protein